MCPGPLFPLPPSCPPQEAGLWRWHYLDSLECWSWTRVPHRRESLGLHVQDPAWELTRHPLHRQSGRSCPQPGWTEAAGGLERNSAAGTAWVVGRAVTWPGALTTAGWDRHLCFWGPSCMRIPQGRKGVFQSRSAFQLTRLRGLFLK